MARLIEIEGMDSGNVKTRLICQKILQILKVMKIYHTEQMEKARITEIKFI